MNTTEIIEAYAGHTATGLCSCGEVHHCFYPLDAAVAKLIQEIKENQ